MQTEKHGKGHRAGTIMLKMKFLLPSLFYCCSILTPALGQGTPPALTYTVSMDHPEAHLFHVVINCTHLPGDSIDMAMSAWTPGYYQLMNFAKRVDGFSVRDAEKNPLKWVKVSADIWRVYTGKAGSFELSYVVKADTRFVAQSYLDSTHAYMVPGSVFLYPVGHIRDPLTVRVIPATGWSGVATGLDSSTTRPFTYSAHDFDQLFDSPILAGNLEELTSFTVKGVPHRFVGVNLGEFDRAQFISDLKRIVETSAAMMGDIPYNQYTFLAIGPGRGGIEHANSCSLSFSGKELNTPAGRLRMLSFIAHEYFHLYNVKRIRPIELGPFDYLRENRTHLLWVSEGFTVYYEYLLVKRAGLSTADELFHAFQSNIAAYENTPGHLYQSLTEASYTTWSDGPFGNSSGSLDKTISYYDKGPVVALLLDFAIRHDTRNQRSLDDVMRLLYTRYYQQQHRGFTDQEFRQACESVAGAPLDELFDYVSTVKTVDYDKYLAYAGLTLVKEGSGFNIQPISQPDELQAAILQSWMQPIKR
jgi:predicted metalloprotease with PDZ domain